MDIERFESDMCTYLAALSTGCMHDPDRIDERWSTDNKIVFVGLLLATLAAGAHFSDLASPNRSEVCFNLIQRALQALRLANFLFRPSLQAIQALFIIGKTILNNGQPGATWALLGTTTRLAQTLGLHAEKGVAYWPERTRSEARAVWSAIVVHECFLSLCYDRPFMLSPSSSWTLQHASRNGNLSYNNAVQLMVRIMVNLTAEQHTSLPRSTELLAELDNTYHVTEAHLRGRQQCHSLEQHLEHLSIQLYYHFCVSFICRPAFQRLEQVAGGPHYMVLLSRVKSSLMNTSKAFLEFLALSVVPLRSWSLVHIALSATLLLNVWEETRNDPECRKLQQQVIDAFQQSECASNVTGPRSSSSNMQWLSDSHIRALIALTDSVRTGSIPSKDTTSTTTPPRPETWESAGLADISSWPGQNTTDEISSACEYGTPFNWDRTDMSPLMYLDSIMNGKSLITSRGWRLMK
ncbi:hypothetical protein V3481_006612 [Fusarium oxysporum f. sp. vasinfectum]